MHVVSLALRCRIKRVVFIVGALAILGLGAWFGWSWWRRAGTAADVAAFIPDDVQVLAFAPRLDAAIHSGLEFARGVNEAAHFRDLFKPEAGVDLGTVEGLRELGLDPEGALALYRREGLLVLLASVEAPDRLELALAAKLKNLGYAEITTLEPDAQGRKLVVGRNPDGAIAAAFAIHNGLLALAYGDGSQDLSAAVLAIHNGPKTAFFASAQGQALRTGLPGGALGVTCAGGTPCPADEPLWFYANPSALLRPERLLRAVDSLALPPLAAGPVKTWLETWAGTVQYAGARLDVSACGTHLEVMLDTTDQTPLLPESWLLPAGSGPSFGALLPRNTVFMAKLGLNLRQIADPILRMVSMGASLGNLLGGEAATDPLAGVLGSLTPELADRHVVTDLLDHLSGHAMVALLGIDRKAGMEVLTDVRDTPRFLANVHLALGVGLVGGRAFVEKWSPKLALLHKLGFEKVERLAGDELLALKLERHCAPPQKPPPPKPGEKAAPPPPPQYCERYGVVVTEDALIITTGASGPGPTGVHQTLARVRAVVTGKAPSLLSLTREPLAKAVLEKGDAPVAAYFSFDGLLNAIANRNLPGGATRYLGQFFELALSLEPRRGDAVGHALLTR